MAQKNHMNKTTVAHHPPKNIVDFELLWKGISKIWNESTQKSKNRIIK